MKIDRLINLSPFELKPISEILDEFFSAWTYITSNFQLILFISNSVVGVKRFMTYSAAYVLTQLESYHIPLC